MHARFPPSTLMQLPGWELVWHRLVGDSDRDQRLGALWPGEHDKLRQRFAARNIVDEEVVTEIRLLFRQAGCDPTRYRPSSEALARRVLRGDELPRINPMVDLNNLLSIRLLAPCCVIDASAVEPPLVLRAGAAGERMQSMRGDFNLDGKILLADEIGAFGTPISDSERVKVGPETHECWIVVYLPQGLGGPQAVREVIAELEGEKI